MRCPHRWSLSCSCSSQTRYRITNYLPGMGNCCGLLSKSKGGPYETFSGSTQPPTSIPTPQDMEARALAAEKAAQRQSNFEKTPVGRAAYTAVKDAKKPVVQSGGQDNAKDWMS